MRSKLILSDISFKTAQPFFISSTLRGYTRLVRIKSMSLTSLVQSCVLKVKLQMHRLMSSFLQQFSVKMKTNKFALQNGLDWTIRNVILDCLEKLLFCLVDVKNMPCWKTWIIICSNRHSFHWWFPFVVFKIIHQKLPWLAVFALQDPILIWFNLIKLFSHLKFTTGKILTFPFCSHCK